MAATNNLHNVLNSYDIRVLVTEAHRESSIALFAFEHFLDKAAPI